MYVIGTAGHVDHGKSALVEALTGTHPDRLLEEQRREMTIDLGFAALTLHGKDGQPLLVGIVDVPGHQDFIENMLSGVGGISMALLVVDANEGVMPQTREHIAILDLMGVGSAVVALTKIDLVEDEEWLQLVSADVTETLSRTSLQGSDIVPVSARTGQGLELLQRSLVEALATIPVPSGAGQPRLFIDRAFSMPGFGTVVTGTLSQGQLNVGDSVQVQPGGIAARIRGLQSHGRALDSVGPTTRVAVNLTGTSVELLGRGQILTAPGAGSTTVLLDCSYRHLLSAPAPLKHNAEVKLHIGSSVSLGRVRVLGTNAIAPGEEGFVQLALASEASVEFGDRFALRRPSPSATIGGGMVLQPYPGRKHKRHDPRLLDHLEQLRDGDTAGRILSVLTVRKFTTSSDLSTSLALDDAELQLELTALESRARIRSLDGYLLKPEFLIALEDRIVTNLTAFHGEYPLRSGIPLEELRRGMKIPKGLFQALIAHLQECARVATVAGQACLAEHEAQTAEAEQAALRAIERRFRSAGFATPSVKETLAELGKELYEFALSSGLMKQISGDVVLLQSQYDEAVKLVMARMKESGTIDVGTLKSDMNSSRKYAIGLLEYLDSQGVTRREGDHRVLTGKNVN